MHILLLYSFISSVSRVYYFLLSVVEQVEAERVSWGQDVVQQVHRSFQVARLNQTLQHPNSIGTEVFQARNGKLT